MAGPGRRPALAYFRGRAGRVRGRPRRGPHALPAGDAALCQRRRHDTRAGVGSRQSHAGRFRVRRRDGERHTAGVEHGAVPPPCGRRAAEARRGAAGDRRRALPEASMKQIAEVVNLIPDCSQHLWSGDLMTARRALLAADPAGVLNIHGSFVLVAQEAERVVLARSLERPLRYFLAKAADGPVLIVAERIDEIATELGKRGWGAQF